MKSAALLLVAGPVTELELLELLQRDGRFIDFIQEDIAGFSDADEAPSELIYDNEGPVAVQ